MEKCVALLEPNGDRAFRSATHDRDCVAAQYSAALPSNSTSSLDLLVDRSKAQAAMRLWDGALEDVIKADDEAIGAFDSMLSLIEQSGDLEIHQNRVVLDAFWTLFWQSISTF
ncbi:hypothetical protein OG21DRAFT_1492179 [Imleria badia]|nr:hypothetical protein OG21DRAFT_1492179 [Imleria badia]